MGSFDFDLFFIDPPSGYADLGGHVMPLGLDQQPPEPSPDTAPRTDEVELSGTDFGRAWVVRFTGAFADDSACIDARIEGAAYDRPLCLKRPDLSLASDGPSMHAWLTEDLYLTAGAVPTDVQDITFQGDAGTAPRSSLACSMGPRGWTDPDRKVCVMTLPPEGSGILRYLDADGNILFEEGIGWGTASPDVPATTVVEAGALEMTATRSGDLLCVRVPDYRLRSCTRGPAPLAAAVLNGSGLSDLAMPAILIWGAVPRDVSRIRIVGDTYLDDLAVERYTHAAFPDINFVLYVAPRVDTGPPCDLRLALFDSEDRQVQAPAALTACPVNAQIP
jgi:hypothetical protein